MIYLGANIRNEQVPFEEIKSGHDLTVTRTKDGIFVTVSDGDDINLTVEGNYYNKEKGILVMSCPSLKISYTELTPVTLPNYEEIDNEGWNKVYEHYQDKYERLSVNSISLNTLQGQTADSLIQQIKNAKSYEELDAINTSVRPTKEITGNCDCYAIEIMGRTYYILLVDEPNFGNDTTVVQMDIKNKTGIDMKSAVIGAGAMWLLGKLLR